MFVGMTKERFTIGKSIGDSPVLVAETIAVRGMSKWAIKTYLSNVIIGSDY